MKKIVWIDNKKYVPKLGIVEYGQQLVVSADTARAFVKQGQAEYVKEKTKKNKEQD